MAFEDRTFTSILDELLAEVDPSLDKREGSIIYDALAPSAALFAQVYMDMSSLDLISFLNTAPLMFLKLRGESEFRTPIRGAIASEREAVFEGVNPPSGSRFLAGSIYWALQPNGNVIAETLGIIGNSVVDPLLIPVNDIEGLTSATLGPIVVPGSEEEDVEVYRTRLREHINNPPLNSNKAHIKEWAESIEGIGRARIFPLDSGPNTVTGAVIDTLMLPASGQLVQEVQTLIEPIDFDNPTIGRGLGEGLADIGCIFTSVAAIGSNINITASIELAQGGTIEQAQTEATLEISKYLATIAFLLSKEQDVVKYTQLLISILNASTILDVQDLRINGNTNNVSIPLKNVAVVGTVVFTEV